MQHKYTQASILVFVTFLYSIGVEAGTASHCFKVDVHKDPLSTFEAEIESQYPVDSKFVAELKLSGSWRHVVGKHYAQYSPHDLFCILSPTIKNEFLDRLLPPIPEGGKVYVLKPRGFEYLVNSSEWYQKLHSELKGSLVASKSNDIFHKYQTACYSSYGIGVEAEDCFLSTGHLAEEEVNQSNQYIDDIAKVFTAHQYDKLDIEEYGLVNDPSQQLENSTVFRRFIHKVISREFAMSARYQLRHDLGTSFYSDGDAHKFENIGQAKTVQSWMLSYVEVMARYAAIDIGKHVLDFILKNGLTVEEVEIPYETDSVSHTSMYNSFLEFRENYVLNQIVTDYLCNDSHLADFHSSHYERTLLDIEA